MKTLLGLTLLALSVTAAPAQYLGSSGLSGTGSNSSSHYVAPHVTSNGTTVQGHQQTNPNSTQLDNYGTRGNLNPYTGAVGTRGARY